MTQSNSTRDVTLNIVIPSYNRDGILTKCLEHLDRVFSPASVNNSNVGINISTTVTVYHQAEQPNSFDVPVENITLRVCNRPKYTGFVFGQMLYDLAHDINSVFPIYNKSDNTKFDFTMLLDDDAHYYKYQESYDIFAKAIKLSIDDKVSCIFINEAERKIKKEFDRYPYQGMGSLFNMEYFDPKKVFSSEFCRIECSVDYMITFKSWVLGQKVYVYGVGHILDKDNNQPGGFQTSIGEKLNKDIKNNHSRYEAIHSLKRSAQHIYPDFFHYQSMGNNKPNIRANIMEYIKNNVTLDAYGNIQRDIVLMPYDKSHNRFFTMGEFSDLTPEQKYQKIVDQVTTYLNKFNSETV